MAPSAAPPLQPFTLESADIAALAEHFHEVVARVARTDSCGELHATSLEAAATLAAALGDRPVTPDLSEVPGEDLMHAGGLMLRMYAPSPAEPYGLWGDAALATATVIRYELDRARTEEELEQFFGEEVAAALDGEDVAVVQDRYQALGCSPVDEGEAIAAHLGLPPRGVERDRAALVALSSLVDETSAASVGEVTLLPLTADERHRASLLLRLLHGPAQPGDDELVTAHLDDVRSTVTGLTSQAEVDEALATLPTALTETVWARVGDAGTCLSLQLHQVFGMTAADPDAPVAVAEPNEFGGVAVGELLDDVDLPACES